MAELYSWGLMFYTPFSSVGYTEYDETRMFYTLFGCAGHAQYTLAKINSPEIHIITGRVRLTCIHRGRRLLLFKELKYRCCPEEPVLK